MINIIEVPFPSVISEEYKSNPLSNEKLAEVVQEFYEHFSKQILTKIAVD